MTRNVEELTFRIWRWKFGDLESEVQAMQSVNGGRAEVEQEVENMIPFELIQRRFAWS